MPAVTTLLASTGGAAGLAGGGVEGVSSPLMVLSLDRGDLRIVPSVRESLRFTGPVEVFVRGGWRTQERRPGR